MQARIRFLVCCIQLQTNPITSADILHLKKIDRVQQKDKIHHKDIGSKKDSVFQII